MTPCTCAALLAAAPFHHRTRAQEPSGPTIASIEFTGLDRTESSPAAALVGIRAGEVLDRERLDDAVVRLIRSGRFSAATYDVLEADGGVRVVFNVQQRPRVTTLRFVGNREFSRSQLERQVPLKAGDRLDIFSVRQGAQTLQTLYRESGFQNARVTVDEEQARTTGEVVYTIEEGARLRVRAIRFEGNRTFKDRTLKRRIETKTAFWIFRTGAFDEDRAAADALRVQSFYRDMGFLDARVAYRTEPPWDRLSSRSDDAGDLTLIFEIEEGTRYRIEDIQFRGHTVFTVEELRQLIQSREGEFVERPQVEADAQAIHTRYGELGYIYATVRPIRVFSAEPGLVRITFEIEEKEQYRVGRVVVRGNARTKDKVVRRALNLYPPHDLFNLSEARAAERRLVETRIFSSARVIPVGDADGVRDVVIDVKEAEKAGDFLFGFGVTSNSGLVGSIVLDLRNFDLFDWPRSFDEFVRFRSFFGAGQHLRLELLPGTTVNRFRVDFTEPYLLDRPVRFDFSGYLFERGRDDYTEGRRGTTVSFGKRFERGRLHGWASELSFRAEDVRVDDVDIFASREVRDDEGSNFLTAVKVTMVRDRTDNRFIPASGDRLRIGYEQVVGEHVFGKVTAGYTWYRTVDTDILGRKKVLQLRAEGGVILGEAPVFERFYAGGTGSIRGFAFRGVGERDGITDTNIGGDFMVLAGAEYSYPLVGENLRGHVFLDTGTAGSGTYRASIGTGVRLTLDVLGPVPLEFNLAIPVSRDGEDEEQVFSFLVGSLF